MVKEKIFNALEAVSEGVEFVLNRPTNETFGEYATNLALVLGKNRQENPRDTAEKIVARLTQNSELMADIETIEIEGPGFINFKLKTQYYLNLIKDIAGRGAFGMGEWGKSKKVLIEYSSPNIAKRFSAGHLRSTIIGDALVRLYKFSGWEVVTDNHLGDWGTQFGMIIAAVEEKNLDVSTMSVSELEDLYVEFNKRMDDDESLRDKAREAFARLENGDQMARKIWRQAKEISLSEFQQIYDQLGVSFDHMYGEADYEALMKEIISEIKAKIGRESEGATIVEFEGIPPAMLVKSNGTTTYFTRDLATIKFRQEHPDLKSNLYIYEVGTEQTLHFRQVFAAAEMMGWAKKEQFVHVAHGLMSLPEGKMSTRKGRTIKLEDLLNLAQEKAAKLGSADEKSHRSIAVGAIKFNELRHAPTSNYVFRWEEALNMEGESGPYLQYALVRVIHVLGGRELPAVPEIYEFNREELALAKWLDRFPETIEAAAQNFSPHLLCSYLFELAQRFNSFYNQHRILQAETTRQRALRLSLTENVGCVLRTGLSLLGIRTVTQM